MGLGTRLFLFFRRRCRLMSLLASFQGMPHPVMMMMMRMI